MPDTKYAHSAAARIHKSFNQNEPRKRAVRLVHIYLVHIKERAAAKQLHPHSLLVVFILKIYN